MNLNHRPYQRSIDLLSIGQLIRGAYAIAPNWNTYSFARLWCMNPATSKNGPRSHLDFSQL